MNINLTRQIVSGVAGAGIWAGQYIADGPVAMRLLFADGGNGPCWMGTRILLDRFPVGLATCQFDGSDFQPLAGAAAATSYGASDDGLNWGLFLADGHTGVQTQWGLSLPDRSWLGMGPALFVKPGSGDAIECYSIGAMAPRWAQPGVTIDFFAVDADRVIWTDGARRLNVRGLPEPEQFEPIYMPSTFEAVGRRWLVYARGQGGFVIRPWDDDAHHGFIVVPLGENAFGPTVVPGDDASHVIGFWSANPSETVIFAKTVDLTAPMVPIETPVNPPAPFAHPVATGVFFSSR